MQPAQQQGRFFPSNNSAQVRSTRRCRVVSCFASSTQQMNSFRPSGVKLSHSIKTFGRSHCCLKVFTCFVDSALGKSDHHETSHQRHPKAEVTSFVQNGGFRIWPLDNRMSRICPSSAHVRRGDLLADG